MTKKKYLILSISLIVVYLSIAVIAFSFANLSREEIFDKGYIVGFLLALSSIPYLFIYLIEDGFHKPQKAVYGAFGIIGIAIGLTSFFLEKKDMATLNTICMIRGIFDIIRLTDALTDIIPMISVEKRKLEIIDFLVSIGEAIIGVLLIIDGFEGLQFHFFFMGCASSILLVKCVIELFCNNRANKNA